MNSSTLNSIFDSYSEDTRTTIIQLRQALMRCCPEFREKTLLGWRALSFTHPSAGYVCGIFPHADRVDIAFEHGNLLSDADNILQRGKTSTKQVRYLHVDSMKTFDEDLLDYFVQQAIEIGRVLRTR